MGSDRHYPEEAPAHKVKVGGFWMSRHTVTNAEFSRFVDETGYVTLAERPANPADYPDAKPELLVPSSVVFQKTSGPVDLRSPYNWWTYVAGADWRHPRGPDSSIDGLADHPVVHVAFEDAEAYAKWAGQSLPTEAEWEFAARGGLDGSEFSWGEEYMPGGQPMANTWQGEFPWQNFVQDGYEWTAPVGSFPPNGYGLLDMAGNVWEWTTDWYGTTAGSSTPAARSTTSRWRARPQLRSEDAGHQNPAQGHEGRLVLLCAELLPALQARGPDGAGGGHLYMPSWISCIVRQTS